MRYYNVTETVEILGISRATLWRLRSRFDVPTFGTATDGRFVYFDDEGIEKLRVLVSGEVFIPRAKQTRPRKEDEQSA